MKISTKGRYSLRLMIDLARHYSEGYLALKDIAARQDISKKYLEQIIPFLTRSGLILSTKGHNGGYTLAKAPEEITILEIIESAEGPLAPVACLDSGTVKCERTNLCSALPIYQGLYDVISNYLGNITLKDLVDQQLETVDYVI